MTWLGANLITSLEDNSTEARICKANYIDLRQAVLEDSNWRFAKGSFKLNTPVTIPDTEWTEYGFKFAKPAGLLLVREGFTDARGDNDAEWEVEGDYIYSNTNPIYINATMDVEAANKMTATFRQALAARIARDNCIGITQSRVLQVDMNLLYEDKLNEAEAVDTQQGINMAKGKSRLNSARHGTLG
jgi:hypothetical protein